MALSDLYNTQPSEQYGVTTTSNNYFEDGAFGLKEKAREAFKEQTGVSYENASQETINDLRESQFNPILEETGAVNDDGSVNEDVMDDITEEVTVDPGSGDDSGGIPVIGGSGGGLPSYVPSLGGNSGSSDPSDGSDFMPFKGLIEGTQNAGSGIAGWLDDTADKATSPDNTPGETGFLQGLIDKAYKSSSEKNFWEKLGFLQKTALVAGILALGPSIIKALGDN